jgi:hypothetical protein
VKGGQLAAAVPSLSSALPSDSALDSSRGEPGQSDQVQLAAAILQRRYTRLDGTRFHVCRLAVPTPLSIRFARCVCLRHLLHLESVPRVAPSSRPPAARCLLCRHRCAPLHPWILGPSMQGTSAGKSFSPSQQGRCSPFSTIPSSKRVQFSARNAIRRRPPASGGAKRSGPSAPRPRRVPRLPLTPPARPVLHLRARQAQIPPSDAVSKSSAAIAVACARLPTWYCSHVLFGVSS